MEILFEITIFSVLVSVCGSVYMNLTVLSITNREGLLESGDCCDLDTLLRCKGKCDTYTEFCLSLFPEAESGCIGVDSKLSFKSKIYENTNSIVMPEGSNKASWTNPMYLTASHWSGYINVFVKVLDSDTWRIDDVIGKFKDNITLKDIPPNGGRKTFKRTLSNNAVNVSYMLEVGCHKNFYGPRCDIYCRIYDGKKMLCLNNGTKVCMKNYHGKKCKTFCQPSRNQSLGFYDCDQDGRKVCIRDYYGANCSIYCAPNPGYYNCSSNGSKVCAADRYGDNCQTFCKATPGKSICTSSGELVCLRGWYGRYCQNHCIEDEVNRRYVCTSDGRKLCNKNWYGRNCSSYCKAEKLKYYCSDNGQKVCAHSRAGPECDACAKNWYGPNCDVFCVAHALKGNAHYSCDNKTGKFICAPDYYGDLCDRYCKPVPGQSVCKDDGQLSCLTGWFGSKCDKNCKVGENKSNFQCDKTGNKVCKENWFGKNCSTHCRPVRDRFICGESGQKFCLKNWIGQGCDQCAPSWHGASCSVYCTPQEDEELGHYDCDSATGTKICHDQYFGKLCNKFCKAIPGKSICTPAGDMVCKKPWYGRDCDVFCDSNSTLTNFDCDDDGQKICLPNWYGPNCSEWCVSNSNFSCDPETGRKVCKTNYHGKECTRFCKALPGRSRCTLAGEHVCLPTWFGTNCSLQCIPSKQSNYKCDMTGSKMCQPNWYGRNCETHCKSNGKSFYCDKDGRKVCMNHWAGTECQKCAENWHGSNCSLPCKPNRINASGHFICDAITGKTICKKDYYGVECKKFCRANGSRSACDQSGNLVCKPTWFGPKCDKNCNSSTSFTCDINGNKVCRQNWYGHECTKYCEPNENTYFCDHSGDKVCINNRIGERCDFCENHWYGQNCEVYCKNRNDIWGHYHCDAVTGQKICLPGWGGDDCMSKDSCQDPCSFVISNSSGLIKYHSHGVMHHCLRVCTWSITIPVNDNDSKSVPTILFMVRKVRSHQVEPLKCSQAWVAVGDSDTSTESQVLCGRGVSEGMALLVDGSHAVLETTIRGQLVEELEVEFASV